MLRVKLAVIGLFVVLFLTFVSTRFFMPTVEGRSGLPAPTGFAASDGSYPHKVGFIWNAVRGANVYRIFRSQVNDPLTAVNVATSASVIDFDFTPTDDIVYYYWVRAENGSIISPFSAADQGSSFSVTNEPGICCPLGTPPVPIQNPVTAAKVFLGKTLFWDEQLSSTRTVSCGTCHIPAKGGSDPRSVIGNQNSTHPGPDNVFGTFDDKTGSRGVSLINAAGLYEKSAIFGLKEQVTRRKSPPVINAAFVPDFLFWDGRAREVFKDPLTNQVLIDFKGALESQSVGPPMESVEMAHQGRDWNQVTSQIASSKPLALSPSMPAGLRDWIGDSTYPELFQEAFGSPEVTPARIAFAIATYERILNSDRTPFDKFAQTTDPVLTAAELRGFETFDNQCAGVCHLGSNFSGNIFFNLGVRPPSEDGGQGEITGNSNQLGQFRTAGLRNIELRAPYMHTGRFGSLEEVVEFYNRGGDFPNGNTIRPLNLSSQQKTDLIAFLKRPLTDPRVAAETPPFDRPTLYTESNRVPVVSGTGVAGSGGVPQAIAAEPPLVGNPSFTVAVSGALGAAQATLVIHSSDPGTSGIPATGSFHRSVLTLGGSGSGNGFGSVSIAIPDNASLVGRTFVGRWYVNDATAPGSVAISQPFTFTVFGEATFAARAKHADFDGDGKTDVSVFRPSDGNWYVLNSSTGAMSAINLGIGTDTLVPEDYDGDGKTDVAIYRDGSWYIQRSRDGFGGMYFGLVGDKPQPGDYDGDGMADEAVFRPSNATWYIMGSRDGFMVMQFGLATDRPVASDYDGDGKTDIAVYRDGVWFIQKSRDGLYAGQFGAAEDKPVMGDYDGDGKADLAVWRPSSGVWYFLKSSDNSLGGNQFGLVTDIASPGDYDGDGKNDLTVFRQADRNWYILPSTSGIFRVQNWGLSQDRSVPGAFVPQ